LRKLIMGAVAASVTLAVVAGAIAQAPEATLTASVSPSDAGTKRKPKNTKIGFKETVNKPGTTVGKIDLALPKTLKMAGKGLGNCTADKLSFEGAEACADDKAGPEGVATAALPDGTPLTFKVQPYVQDSNSLVLRIFGALAIDTPISGEITNQGRKLTITIPAILRQPGGAFDATLTSIDQSFTAKKGKKFLVSSIGCKNHKHNFAGTLTFSERLDGTPVPPPLTEKASAKCKK
jgi:hypothetical protein